MRRAIAITILTAILVLGCSTVTGISEKMRDEAQSLCVLWRDLREPVVLARDGAIEHWDKFSPEQQAALRDIDDRLKDLDRAGQLACLVAESEKMGKKFDWNAVKAVLFDSLRLVVELQSKGIIQKL